MLGTLGRGGFGIVYKARQRTTGQLVAIKTMLPRPNATRPETLLARFVREAQLCAQLYHPNIVPLINSGMTAAGMLYSVFAYIPGSSLSQILKQEGALEPEEACHLMLQVLDALACAHSAGIIHRDLTPSNIMVVPTGARRNALVLDFGIGTVVRDADSGEYERLTGASEVLGTPGYAAPEQLGNTEVSPATDLFSWGIVFLEALMGTPVYTASSPQQTLYQQLGPSPVPIPAALRTHPLGKLLAAVTCKDAVARPQSAKKLLTQLRACNLRALSREVIASQAEPTHHNLTTTMTFSGPARPPQDTEEKRQVTAVCCDLRLSRPPSTERNERTALDVEEHDRALHTLFAVCEQVIQQYDGLLVATFGEQALFFFGYPQTDEQAGRRAARAALAVRIALTRAGERRAVHGLSLATRIGIHVGLVVSVPAFDEFEASITVGETSRITAQLARVASADTILVSAPAQRRLRAWFDFEAHGAIDDGPAPVKIYRLHGERREDVAVPAAQAVASVLVGREPELQLLMQRWAQVQTNKGQCSLITGEPGIGKSRLADAVRERAAPVPHTLLVMRSSPDTQNSPAAPVIELVDRLIDREADSAQASKLARLEQLLSRHGLDLSVNLPLLAALQGIPLADRYPPLDISPEFQRTRTLDALRELLFAMADARPMLLLIEDLHWLDATTLELIGQLVERLAAAPIYLLLTARPELSQASLPTTGVLQIALSRLGSDEIEALVAELLEGRELPEEVVEQIVKRTDGVPLFVEEFAQMLIESGVVVLRGERYELARPLRDSDIPSSLRDLLTSRLDRLGKAKDTAQLAATIGRDFGIALLGAASDRPADILQADIEKLQGAGLIRARRKKGDSGWAFKHALIRDAAYASMTNEAQRRTHARVAEILEGSLQGSAVELARHHAGAGAFDNAIRHGTAAAHASIARGANVEALAQTAQLTSWLSNLSDAARPNAELHINAITLQALMSKEGWASPNVRALAERSRALFPAGHSTEHKASILYGLFLHYRVSSDLRQGHRVADELIELSDQIGDRALQAVAAIAKGSAFHAQGHCRESETWLNRAIEQYGVDPDQQHGLTFGLDTRVWASALQAWAWWGMGRTTEAFQVAHVAVAWAREVKHIPSVGIALLYLGQLHQMNGDKASARSAIDELVDLAAMYGLPAFAGYGAAIGSWVVDDLEGVRRTIEILESIHCNTALTYYGAVLAEIAANTGDIPAAIAYVDTWLAKCGPLDEHFYEPVLHVHRALYEMRLPAPDLAVVRGSLDHARRLAREQSAARYEALAIMETLRIFGDSGELRDRLTELHGRFPDLKSL